MLHESAPFYVKQPGLSVSMRSLFIITIPILAVAQTSGSSSCIAALDSSDSRAGLPFHPSISIDRIGSVNLTFHLPPGSFQFESRNGKWVANLEWYIAQHDAHGKRFAELWNGSMQLNFSDQALADVRKNGYTFRRRVAPSSQAKALRIAICEERKDGRAGAQNVSLGQASVQPAPK